MGFLTKLLSNNILQWFLSKKKIISFIAGLAMAAIASLLGMRNQEFKDAVCSAQVAPDVPHETIPAEPKPEDAPK